MGKVKLSVDELKVESFGIDFEQARGTVNANEFAPTAPTRECACIALTSPAVCG
jgi:hypothetical protein